MPHLFREDPDHIFRSPDLEAFTWLEHGFATRNTDSWPDPERLAMAKQIHSAIVIEAEGTTGYIGEADALVTNRPELWIGVRTADCVPILLADPNKRAVAAVHAGWRGTAKSIVECAVRELEARYGTAPADIRAAIGPAIGKCCYEVGAEVAAHFVTWCPEFGTRTGPVKLDLESINRTQLEQAGVIPDSISTAGLCTFCTPGAFHSFRRDQDRAGRMISAIRIKQS